MLKKYIWINGKTIATNRETLKINDIGFLRGYGVFDFMRTYNGKIFRYNDHYRRFVNSAKTLDLKVPFKQTALEEKIYQLMRKNKANDASIRLVLSGGETKNGIDFNPQKPTFAILIEDLYELPTKLFLNGAKLITFNYQRLLPTTKNFNYIWAVKLQKEKNKQKAIEILFIDNDKILECSTSNFFLIKNQKIITTKDNILPGITRKVVIELAKKEKIEIEERPIKINELKEASEAFITATNKNVLPIVEINKQKIGTGKPGPISQKLLSQFKELTKK